LKNEMRNIEFEESLFYNPEFEKMILRGTDA